MGFEGRQQGKCTCMLWEACFLDVVVIDVVVCHYFLGNRNVLGVFFIYSTSALYWRSLCEHYVHWGVAKLFLPEYRIVFFTIFMTSRVAYQTRNESYDKQAAYYFHGLYHLLSHFA